jgi:hypothetical protein
MLIVSEPENTPAPLSGLGIWFFLLGRFHFAINYSATKIHTNIFCRKGLQRNKGRINFSARSSLCA